jgi:hypothetical protein
VVSDAGIARVIARIILDGGAIDTSTFVTDSYALNNFRCAATVDGTGYWTAGTSLLDAGIRYVAAGSQGTSSAVNVDVQNVRATHVVAGQLYAGTGSGPQPDGGYSRVWAVGSGLPMTSAPLAPLPGVMATGVADFALLDLSTTVTGPDTLYVGDSANDAGVRKYVSNGTTWAEGPQLQANVPANTACFNVAAKVIGGNVVVLCAAGNGTVYRFDEVNGTAGAATALTTAPTGTVFRGVAFVP